VFERLRVLVNNALHTVTDYLVQLREQRLAGTK
jgi:hypothetical protein